VVEYTPVDRTGMRTDAPAAGWQAGLLVTVAYFSLWGAMLATRGLTLGPGPAGLSPSSGRFPIAVVAFGVALAGLVATLSIWIRSVRSGRAKPAIAGQMTSGGLLTLAVLISMMSSAHAAELRRAYAVMPPATALAGYAALAAIVQAASALASRGGRRSLDATLGLVAVGGLIAFLVAASLVGPAVLRTSDVWNSIEWGGDVAIATLAAMAALLLATLRVRGQTSPPPPSTIITSPLT
jgi:hypothetical protein